MVLATQLDDGVKSNAPKTECRDSSIILFDPYGVLLMADGAFAHLFIYPPIHPFNIHQPYGPTSVLGLKNVVRQNPALRHLELSKGDRKNISYGATRRTGN